MSTDLLAADTRMGAVTLRVADLDTMTAYYRDGVMLQVRDCVSRSVMTLGSRTKVVGSVTRTVSVRAAVSAGGVNDCSPAPASSRISPRAAGDSGRRGSTNCSNVSPRTVAHA